MVEARNQNEKNEPILTWTGINKAENTEKGGRTVKRKVVLTKKPFIL